MTSTRTAMDWNKIEREIKRALPIYSDRKYIKESLFAEWLIEHKEQYPHITKGYVRNFDCASRIAIMYRITQCVGRLGWRWHLQRVFVNPYCIEETIFIPISTPVLSE